MADLMADESDIVAGGILNGYFVAPKLREESGMV